MPRPERWVRAREEIKAEALFERLVELNPGNVSGETGLGHAALDQGRVDEARERYTALAGDAPAATI